MSLLDVMNASTGGATQDYFSTIGKFQANKALQIFNSRKYNPVQQPEAAATLRDQAMSYYKTILEGEETSGPTYSDGKSAIKDPRIIRLMNKVIQSKLSFADKKVFLDELVDEYWTSGTDDVDAFIAKIEQSLASAEAKKGSDGKLSSSQEQILRLYVAEKASGTDMTSGMSLLNYLA